MLGVLGVRTEHSRWHWVGNAFAGTKCNSSVFSAQTERGACGLEGSREEPRAALCVVPMEVTPGQKVPSRAEWLRAKLWVVQPRLCGAEPGLPRFTFCALNSLNAEADGEIQEDTTKDQAGLPSLRPQLLICRSILGHCFSLGCWDASLSPDDAAGS